MIHSIRKKLRSMTITEAHESQEIHPSSAATNESSEQKNDTPRIQNAWKNPAIICPEEVVSEITNGNCGPHSILLHFDDKEACYAVFMKAHRCHDIMPNSTKIVIFDSKLSIKAAFMELLNNKVPETPIWDEEKKRFIGTLSMTDDFINIMCQYYKSSTGMKQQLEQLTISAWRESDSDNMATGTSNERSFNTLDPYDSIFKAILRLFQLKLHRLAVVDNNTGNVLHFIAQKRILKFLHLYMFQLPRPSFMDKGIRELGIGTWNKDTLKTVGVGCPLSETFQLFITHGYSAFPVVDEQNHVVDIYSKFDVIGLIATDGYENLDGTTVKQALKYRSGWFEGVEKCSGYDTLEFVIDKIVNAEVHRLVATDENGELQGIISLSDILFFLVLTELDCCVCSRPDICRFRH